MKSKTLLLNCFQAQLQPLEFAIPFLFSQCVQQVSVLVVIGYSFGDSYINEIIYQGMRTNTRLKLVVVAPDAEAVVSRNSLLNKNPRVYLVPSGAKEVLGNRALLRQVKAIVTEVEQDEPFK